MIGTGIPAYAPGTPAAPRSQPVASRSQPDPHGSRSFDDAVNASGRKQDRESSPSQTDTTASAASAASQPAGDTKPSHRADQAPSSQQSTASAHGKADDTATHHGGRSKGDEEGKDGDRPHEKHGHAASAVALPLVMSQAIAILSKATGDSGSDTPEGAAAEQAKPAAGKATAAQEKAAAAQEEAKAKAAGQTAPDAGAKIEAQSIRVDDRRSGTSSALSDLHARLSRSDTAGDTNAKTVTAAPKSEQPSLQGKKAQPDSSDAGNASPRREHASAAGSPEAASTPPTPPASPTSGASLQARNIAALADTIVSRPDWSQALAQGAGGISGSAQQAGPVSSLKLQLNPADLGTVTATLRVSGNQLVINLQVQTAEAYRQLSTGNDSILDKLKGHGYAVENITVQHIAVGTSATSQAQQQQQHTGFASQQGGQQAAAGGGQRFAGQGQGGRQAAPLFEPAGALAGESQSDARSGSRGAGGVYV